MKTKNTFGVHLTIRLNRMQDGKCPVYLKQGNMPDGLHEEQQLKRRRKKDCIFKKNSKLFLSKGHL